MFLSYKSTVYNVFILKQLFNLLSISNVFIKYQIAKYTISVISYRFSFIWLSAFKCHFIKNKFYVLLTVHLVTFV